MSIGTPTNATGSAGGDVTTHTLPQITVAAGDLVIAAMGRYSPTSDPMVVGDISATGTATLGSWSLDQSNSGTTDGGSSYAATGIFSCIASTSGTVTVTIAGHPATSYVVGGVFSASGSWDSSRFEAGNGNVNSSASTTVTTNSATSAGAALFVAVCQINTGQASITDDANFTNVYKLTTTDTGAIAYRIVGSGTTDACDWTVPTAAVYGASLAVYKEVGGGGGGGGTTVAWLTA